MVADRTFLRCIGRIYKDQGDTRDSRLVGHKLSELAEAPRSMIMSLRLSNGCPVSDTLEIFERYQRKGAFSLRDQSFRDLVIHISGISGHSPRQLFKMPFGALSTTLLEPAFEGIRPLASISNLLARMDLAIAVYGEILNSKIDTKNIDGIVRRFFGNLYNSTKVENILFQDKIGLASHPIHSGFLVFPDSDRDKLPAFKSDQRYILKSLPSQDTLIINNSTIWPKFWLNRFISLICLNHFGNRPDGELRRESISFSDWIVNSLVDFNLVGLMHSKSCSGDVITGFIEAVHGIKEQLMLLRAWIESDHQGLKHCTEECVQLVNNFGI